jgi:hypothetical protein
MGGFARSQPGMPVESMARDSSSWRTHVLSGLGASTRHNALAYGYSLAVTGAFGILDVSVGRPRALDVFLFAFGAAVTFMLANANTTRGFRRRVREEPPLVRAVGSSLGFVSVGAIAGAWLVSWAVGSWPAWLVGAFVASGIYLLLSALELGFARLLRPLLPVDQLEGPEADEDEGEPE